MKLLKGYYARLMAITGLLGVATWITGTSWKINFPPYTYMALIFLGLVMAVMNYWVYDRPSRDGKVIIRRLMAASMMRMFVAAAFMGITLYSFRPVSLPYVAAYCAYFAAFLLFEISQMRYKLRPDFKPRPE